MKMNLRALVTTVVAVLCLALADTAHSRAVNASGTVGGNQIVAIGDIHGDFDGLTALLRDTGLVDGAGDWRGGESTLVIVGDAVDRGKASRRVLDLLMKLEVQAPEAGGRVHVLLGNHEAMWLTGDHEYTSREDYAAFKDLETEAMREQARERFQALRDSGQAEGDFDSLFPPGALGMRRALSKDGNYGQWLTERPVAVVVNDTAFVHGGLSESFAGKSAEGLNELARNEIHELLDAWDTLAEAGVVAPEYPLLSAARALKPHAESGAFDDYPARVRGAVKVLTGAADSLLFDPDGPLWYRGNATCHPLAEAHLVERALDGLGARRLVVSHTPLANELITGRLDGRLIRIDTGERAAALVLGDGAPEAVYADGTRRSPVPGDARHRAVHLDLGAEDVERFLREGKVVKVEDVGAGVTNPQRVTLEMDGMRIRAIFKTEATPERSTGRFSSRRLTDIADRHAYELAAYRLDRLLGLGMVPPAVERRIGRDTGTLQYWVENAMNDRTRRQQGIEPEPACPLAKDYALLELFDRLIYNTDRTQENILYLPDWRVVLIDHTRAFRTHSGRPETVRHVDPDEVPAFAARLAALDEEAVREALDDLLDSRQIRALLERRDEIVAEWQGAGADR